MSSDNGIDSVLQEVRGLLRAGRAKDALSLLDRAKAKPPALRDAYGVCLMRLGHSEKAVDLYRGMLLPDGGVVLDPRAPAQFKVNYATALLLTGNVAGCAAALDGLNNGRSEVLRGTIDRWKRSLPWWKRWATALNGLPYDAAVPLDGLPGEV